MNFDIAFPADETAATRCAWARERLAEYRAGNLPREVGWFVWALVVGWTDLCAPEQLEEYLSVGCELAEALQSRTPTPLMRDPHG